MIILGLNDIFTSKRVSLIADYDKDTIFNLYQPLIGATASALYMSLLVEAKNQKVTNLSTHEKFLIKTQMTTQEFLKARAKLEAVGLLKTYIEDPSSEIKTYHYEIYAPKSPEVFFGNTLLYGLLIKYIGESEASKLKMIYNENVSYDKGSDISKSFKDVFNPDVKDPIFLKALNASNKQKGRNTAKIDSEFNYERFFEELSMVSQIKKEAITKKELKEIERISALYALDESGAARIVSEIYDPKQEKGLRVDPKQFTYKVVNENNFSFVKNLQSKQNTPSNVSSDNDLAVKINLMESLSPREFLSILQNGSKPAASDLFLIDSLSKDFNLPPSVINVLVDYVLETNHNILNKTYVEKIAASLAREGVDNALDAMNYLKGVRKSMTKPRARKQDNKNSEIKEEKKETPSEDDDGISWEDLINEIEGDNNNE